MKTKLIGFFLFALTATLVSVYPTLRGSATDIFASQPSGPAEVEVVFVLDTTGSMGGLIAAAKEKIWSIATTLAQAEQAPRIRMGLVAYRDRGDSYVTEVVDLSSDLDSMYARLMDFQADGGGDGPESVNRALADAVHGISWSQSPSSYKVIFLVGDAPPHMDYNESRYPEIVAAAARKDIVVNTIQCGDLRDTVPHFTRIAALGNGRYMQVEQAGSAVVRATPYDADLARLAAELDDTRLYYGSMAEIAVSASKVEATDKLEAGASEASRARRAVFNASASGAESLFGDNELIEDVAAGRVELDEISAEELPATLRPLSAPEQRAAVEDAIARRQELKQRIDALAAERDGYLRDELEAAGGIAGSLDAQIYETVREQAADKGLSYEGGPKL